MEFIEFIELVEFIESMTRCWLRSGLEIGDAIETIGDSWRLVEIQ